MSALITSSNIAFAGHTTEGATFWYNVCISIDLLIIEPCGILVSTHDAYNQGLSTEGWRVAKCVAGGGTCNIRGTSGLIDTWPCRRRLKYFSTRSQQQ